MIACAARTFAEYQRSRLRPRRFHFSVNAMSAISTRGRMHFMVFTKSFNAKVMYRFLARLVGHFDRKIHLIVDRHSAHRSKTVRDWLASHQNQIELHFLTT
ncbi:transposase [Streptomyces goshikiensis]|uniref:transposase n=1 Tax=Streptomyces goshikiensis TaxID=1942 RepID=UPI003F4C7BCD